MSHYETLDIASDASADDIKQAFRRKAQSAHPDKGGSHDAMAQLNQAYKVLGNDERRAHYDETGDDDEVPTLEDQAVHKLQQVFEMLLGTPGDFIQAVRKTLLQSLRELHKEMDGRQKMMLHLLQRRDSISVKQGENLVHALIDSQLQQARQRLARCTDGLAIAAHMQKLLDQYESSEGQTQSKLQEPLFG